MPGINESSDIEHFHALRREMQYRWSRTPKGHWALQIVERTVKQEPQHIENTNRADWLKFCADEETGQYEMEPHQRAKLEEAYVEAVQVAA